MAVMTNFLTLTMVLYNVRIDIWFTKFDLIEADHCTFKHCTECINIDLQKNDDVGKGNIMETPNLRQLL